MSDLKLFRVKGNDVAQLTGGAVALERSLQLTFEKNLDALLGVRFGFPLAVRAFAALDD